MKPLNHKERTGAYLKFLGMYFLTILLTGALIYLTAYTIPDKSSDLSQSQLQQQQKFILGMDSLMTLMATLETVEEEVAWSEHVKRITSLLVEMEQTFLDPRIAHPIYEKVLASYQLWASDKEKVREARSENEKLAEKLEEAKSKGGGGKEEAELKAAQKELQKHTTLAGNILNQINTIRQDVGKIKGLKDQKDKDNINAGLDRIRSLADRIQN